MSVSTVRYRTSNYSDYLSQIASLIGVDSADLQTPELTMLNNFFNRAYRKIYESQLWPETCPFGEVRFPLDLIGSPNDLTNTSFWTPTASTAAGNVSPNPLDNRVTSSSITPTTATATHYLSSASGLFDSAIAPNQSYILSGWVKPNGYNYFTVAFSDGIGTCSLTYTLTQPTPSVGTITNTLNSSFPANASIQAMPNGWLFWSVQFTSSTNASPLSAKSVILYVNSTSTNATYSGDGVSGLLFWGVTLSPGTNQVPASYFIPYNQLGEAGIETVFDVWGTDPGSSLLPGRCNYQLSADGINVIGAPNLVPYYLYYRPQRPIFSGTTYAASTAYIAGQYVYFSSTATLTNGQANFYKSLSATTAGQSPDTNPTKWQQLFIPYTFLQFCVYNAYADWLMTEGQTAKAAAMYVYGQSCLDDENDKVERQNGNIMPMRVSTHLTSQQRGMGFQNQNYLPQGSYYVN